MYYVYLFPWKFHILSADRFSVRTRLTLIPTPPPRHQPASSSLHFHPLTCLPSLLTLFLLRSIQLGITGLHIIFCSTSESRLFKISVIFLSLCVYLMGLSVHLQRAAVFAVVASGCIQMLHLSEVCDEREQQVWRSGDASNVPLR